MTTINNAAGRMKWEDIVKTYPDLWVGLIDIDWEDDANIRSAIVLYTDEGCDELLKKQFEKEIEYSCYTTPDNLGITQNSKSQIVISSLGGPMKQIYLARGCFWGTQKFFDQFDGIIETEVGYANGKYMNPSYEQVCYGDTGHAEVAELLERVSNRKPF